MSDCTAAGAKTVLKEEGWGLIPPSQYLTDMEDEFLDIWEKVRAYTMISVERGYALYKGVRYTVQKGIPGDFVECGVWKGGACMLMALTLEKLGGSGRRIYMYDTYSGMPEPTDEDVIAWNGVSVKDRWKNDAFSSWAVGLKEVQDIIGTVVPDMESFVFVKGDVIETLEREKPSTVSLLRLDTDWYASTAKELEILYPLLSRGGILQIDDYGHFKGARKAVDEYFRDNSVHFSRIDYTGRESVKL